MASNKALKYRIRTIPRTLTISSKWMGKREKIICLAGVGKEFI